MALSLLARDEKTKSHEEQPATAGTVDPAGRHRHDGKTKTRGILTWLTATRP
jgi:hypothetical protein